MNNIDYSFLTYDLLRERYHFSGKIKMLRVLRNILYEVVVWGLYVKLWCKLIINASIMMDLILTTQICQDVTIQYVTSYAEVTPFPTLYHKNQQY